MIRNMCLDNRYTAPSGLSTLCESRPGIKIPGYCITLLRSKKIALMNKWPEIQNLNQCNDKMSRRDVR